MLDESNRRASMNTRPTHYFIVAGISLTSIQKELKPALPKRRQKESYLVVISSDANSIKIAVAGGAITLPAITSGPFLVELPYLEESLAIAVAALL
jgi:hypothetical protein